MSRLASSESAPYDVSAPSPVAPAALPAPRLSHPKPSRLDAATLAAAPASTEWSFARRVAFRFAFIYFIIYSLPFPLQELPIREIFGQDAFIKYFQWLQEYQNLWQKIVPWVGNQLFGIDITVFPNGSGDTTFNYVQVLCFVTIALVGTIFWSAIDRNRAAYPRLHEWLRVYVRYVLALTMLSYGFAKVVPGQFPPPGPERLMQTYGSSSPMGLLWTFMGASTAYTFFAGLMECLGGVLLFPRRTVTLGAMVVSGVMLNVVLLNFCYDVPVKLYSSHLLLMAMWLTLPDLRALMSVLLRMRPIAPTPVTPLFARRWINYPALLIKLAFVGFTLYGGVQQSIALQKQMNDRSGLSPLAGVYEVESFTRTPPPTASTQSATAPAAADDGSRWKRVVISDYKQILVLAVQQVDEQMPRYRVTDDPAAKTISISLRSDPTMNSTLAYGMPEPGILTFDGEFMGQPISVRLRRGDADKWLLTTRGFRWINEYPFNR